MTFRYSLHICFLFLLFLCVSRGVAQDTCEEGTAVAELNIGNVRASLHNNGNLFYDGDSLYEVPKGSGNTALFASTIWLGGMVGSELRMAATTYARYEFRPGPLFADGTAPTDCTPYDRFWTVSREDLARYDATGEATADLRDWPVELGAPVVDGDGNPDNYDLTCGDRPAILGEQAVWWVMNDVSAEHANLGTAPIGLEAKVMAFAFNQVGLVGNSTFYRYRLTYRGDTPLREAYFGIWADLDLGGPDNYIGSDSVLNLGYVYNADNTDSMYGDRPPALGYAILRGPRGNSGERLGMTNFLSYVGASDTRGDPFNAPTYYNYLRGVWLDGFPMTFGGLGRNFSEQRAHFMFPSDPTRFWSEENIDDQGTTNAPGPRRFIVSTGPFSMEPGETQEILFAIVWSRAAEGAANPRLASQAKLEADVRTLPGRLGAIEQLPAPGACILDLPYDFDIIDNFPEPSSGTTTLMVDLPEEAEVRVDVYDMLGRRVLEVPPQAMAAGRRQPIGLDASSLVSGMYLYRVTIVSSSGRRRGSGRMVVVR